MVTVQICIEFDGLRIVQNSFYVALYNGWYLEGKHIVQQEKLGWIMESLCLPGSKVQRISSSPKKGIPSYKKTYHFIILSKKHYSYIFIISPNVRACFTQILNTGISVIKRLPCLHEQLKPTFVYNIQQLEFAQSIVPTGNTQACAFFSQ